MVYLNCYVEHQAPCVATSMCSAGMKNSAPRGWNKLILQCLALSAEPRKVHLNFWDIFQQCGSSAKKWRPFQKYPSSHGFSLTCWRSDGWKSFSVFLYRIFLHEAVAYGLIAGLGVTAGMHRMWAHRSYSAKTPLRIVLACLYCMMGQVSMQ